MGSKSKWIITVIVLMLILVGCSASKEDILDETKAVFVESFHTEMIEANQETDRITYYLPNDLHLTEKSDNNLIFEKGDQIFLLFYNPVEGLDSQVNMERDLEFENSSLLFETIEDDERFGYLMVISEDEDMLKLIMGIGGYKMTTFTTLSDLTACTEIMADVINSIEYKDK